MTQKPLVITIANRKGGTGKTTTAVNLAAEWGKKGYKTLIIDLDTQGHVSVGTALRELDSEPARIHDIFSDKNINIQDIVRFTKTKNVWVAPADTTFVGRDLKGLLLRNYISENEGFKRFDRIVIDTPPTLDSLLINSMAAANGVIVPFVPHHLSSVGVNQLAKLFYQVATKHNSELRLLGLLPVMYDRNIKLHKRVLESLEKQYGKGRMLRGIRTNIKLAEAFEAGSPVKDYVAKCTGSMDYQLLAEELETFFIK
ncbi:MAG: ParA family protein [Enterobacterales bacterium]|nr:ParA family protein [Enterobacterales bacterium]